MKSQQQLALYIFMWYQCLWCEDILRPIRFFDTMGLYVQRSCRAAGGE